MRPKTLQDAPKAPPRRPKTLSRQPQDAPKTSPRRPKTPKMPQDAQLERDVRPVCPQDSPKTSQESLKINFGRFLLDLGLIFGRLFIEFGSVFNRILMHVAFKKEPLKLKNPLNSIEKMIFFFLFRSYFCKFLGKLIRPNMH